MPLFHVRTVYFASFPDEFRLQQDVIINSLIDLNREHEFEQIEWPIVTAMESMFFGIKSLIASSYCNSGQQFRKFSYPNLTVLCYNRRSFHDIYVSLVHNNRSIGDAERFHYLISCLSDFALSVVKSMPLSSDNYAVAWGALSNRFLLSNVYWCQHIWTNYLRQIINRYVKNRYQR